MITVEYDGREVLDYLNRLSGRMGDMSEVMADIGEYLTETTKRRFETSTAPDAQPWAPNTEVTLLRYLGVYDNSYTKSGKLSAHGVRRVTNKRPLIGELGFKGGLAGTIHYIYGRDFVEVGSNKEYAATHQFGASQGQYGNTRRGAPIPWGDIPARPFLGVSDADEREILDIVAGYLAG